MSRQLYANDTWLETCTMWDLYCHGAALCSDGKVRALARIAAVADTFFTIPAAVKVDGKTVSGVVAFKDVMRPMSDVTGERLNPNSTLVFYAHGKNRSVLPDWT